MYLFGTGLSGADLRGADLRTAVGLSQEEINAAKGDSDTTKLPENLHKPKNWGTVVTTFP